MNKESVFVKIIVDTSKSKLKAGHNYFDCALGKNGMTPFDKGREGDGKTPLGTYTLRYGLYRKDRIKLPKTDFPFHEILQNDGWCDAPNDPAYNRPVRLPYNASAEKLWKDSHVYDVVIVLGHNDNPPVPNLGSAIFLHIARENYPPTQGCVAISKEDMLDLLPSLTKECLIEIR